MHVSRRRVVLPKKGLEGARVGEVERKARGGLSRRDERRVYSESPCAAAEVGRRLAGVEGLVETDSGAETHLEAGIEVVMQIIAGLKVGKRLWVQRQHVVGEGRADRTVQRVRRTAFLVEGDAEGVLSVYACKDADCADSRRG